MPQVLPIPVYEPGPQTHGWAVANKNDRVFWEASGVGNYFGEDSTRIVVVLKTYSAEGAWREHLGFGPIPFGRLGEYRLYPNDNSNPEVEVQTAYSTFIADGDVIGAIYVLDESTEDNRLEITFVDTLRKVIGGIFTATFVLDPEYEDYHSYIPYHPDTVKFSKGRFQVEIVQ